MLKYLAYALKNRKYIEGLVQSDEYIQHLKNEAQKGQDVCDMWFYESEQKDHLVVPRSVLNKLPASHKAIISCALDCIPTNLPKYYVSVRGQKGFKKDPLINMSDKIGINSGFLSVDGVFFHTNKTEKDLTS